MSQPTIDAVPSWDQIVADHSSPRMHAVVTDPISRYRQVDHRATGHVVPPAVREQTGCDLRRASSVAGPETATGIELDDDILGQRSIKIIRNLEDADVRTEHPCRGNPNRDRPLVAAVFETDLGFVTHGLHH